MEGSSKKVDWWLLTGTAMRTKVAGLLGDWRRLQFTWAEQAGRVMRGKEIHAL